MKKKTDVFISQDFLFRLQFNEEREGKQNEESINEGERKWEVRDTDNIKGSWLRISEQENKSSSERRK